MTNRNYQLFSAIVNKIENKQLEVVFGKVPNYALDLVKKGRDYKRAGRYDEAFEAYIQAISICDCLYTELGRMFCKTLCSMNEYYYAMYLLFVCAAAKWEESTIPKTGDKLFDEMIEKRFGSTSMSTACANDFFELRDCVVKAANGDLKPLFERTKEVSGNPNYRNVKTDYEIRTICYDFCKDANLLE